MAEAGDWMLEANAVGNRNRKSKIENLESPSEPPSPKRDKEDDWDAPAFRNEVLWTLIFVAVPAIVMFVLREYKIAAAWFGVGMLIIVFESRRQIRDFWRALRSGGRNNSDKDT